MPKLPIRVEIADVDRERIDRLTDMVQELFKVIRNSKIIISVEQKKDDPV